MAKATFRFYEESVEISKRENRIILTGDRKLLKYKDVAHGMFVRPGTTVQQIQRILDALYIKDRVAPFTRCLGCNTLLCMVPKEAVLDRIPPKTRAYCNAYARCPSCDKIYWKGTHYIHMQKVVKHIIDL